jgi:protease PrsW
MTAAAGHPVRNLLSHQVRWVAVLVVGSALYAAVLAALLGTGDLLYVPSLLLLGAAIVPVTFVTFVGLQRRGLSVAQVAAVAVLGGVLATVIAGSLEYASARELGSLPTWIVGLAEEAAKLVVPAVILLWRKPSPLDGVIFGVAVGGCFAMLETMGYGFVALLRSGGNLEGVTELLAVRSVSEPGGHAAWTGLAAAALFAIRGSRRRWLGWLRFLAVFAGVVWLHATWDRLGTEQGYLIIGAVSFGLLMATTWWLYRTRSGPGSPGPPAPWAVRAALADYLSVTGRGR